MPNSTEIESLIQEVQNSSKYANLPPSLVNKIGTEELKKHGTVAEALKPTRTKLHQLVGAFIPHKLDYTKWLAILKHSLQSNACEHLNTLKQIMRLHASTNERLPYLERVYQELFTLFPKPKSILDLACGLNPLAIPWMPIDSTCAYRAGDVVLPMLDFLKQYFAFSRPQTEIMLCDLLDFTPDEQFDLIMILKTFPLLAQIEKQAPERLLNDLKFNHLLISYPLKSLSNRSKGMERTYRGQFERLIEGKPFKVVEYALPNELFFLISHEN